MRNNAGVTILEAIHTRPGVRFILHIVLHYSKATRFQFNKFLTIYTLPKSDEIERNELVEYEIHVRYNRYQ